MKSTVAQCGGRRKGQAGAGVNPSSALLPRKRPFHCLSEPVDVQNGVNTSCLIGLLAKIECFFFFKCKEN